MLLQVLKLINLGKKLIMLSTKRQICFDKATKLFILLKMQREIRRKKNLLLPQFPMLK